MKPVVIKLKKKIKYRIDMSFLSNLYKHKSLNSFRSKIIIYGNKEYKAKDIFHIEGNDVTKLILKSSNDLMDNIGKDLSVMSIKIYGDVGCNLGLRMKSGSIKLHGNATSNVACGMMGGKIFIFGNTGDYLCAKPNSSNEGLVDGLIYVKGNVGDYSLHKVRRGNIIIDGNLGKYACKDLLSGSILINGKVGDRFGEGIKRGTIFTSERNIIKKYSRSINAKFNFIELYNSQVSKIVNKPIFTENKKLQRYQGHVDSNNLSEVFFFNS